MYTANDVHPKLISAYASMFLSIETGQKNGLLCRGGDLHPARLLAAYSLGIFPWYDETLPILWWSPDPRCVILPNKFSLPARSARAIRRKPFLLTLDTAFSQVIRACAMPRRNSLDANATWITAEMIRAYEILHDLGYAHSVEAWMDDKLVGGLYGIALGKAFFGESMFCTVSEASRAALAGLIKLLRQRGSTLLDCQQETPHIMRMGGSLISRRDFLQRLQEAMAVSDAMAPWKESYIYSATSGSWESRS